MRILSDTEIKFSIAVYKDKHTDISNNFLNRSIYMELTGQFSHTKYVPTQVSKEMSQHLTKLFELLHKKGNKYVSLEADPAKLTGNLS